jgi:demethylmenaquinone methyltransferase / 2-methoxy-6-polyprenyl-1,4-benzoquinol methylase
LDTNTQHQGPQPEKIRQMFSQVASGYDRANSVLSVGIHHLWRRDLVKWSGAQLDSKVLDCATGTGDLAIEFKKVAKNGAVIGTDFCEDMLAFAPAKAAAKNLDISFSQADVTQLPYADKSFDITSISFGIRNVGNPQKGIDELARVTKSGGSVMILEFGQVKAPVIGPLYSFYSEKVLPIIGGLVTGQGQAYKYLQESSAQFPCREKFVSLMMSTGKFKSVEFKSLTGGIAYIYKGTVA